MFTKLRSVSEKSTDLQLHVPRPMASAPIKENYVTAHGVRFCDQSIQIIPTANSKDDLPLSFRSPPARNGLPKY